MCWFFLQSPVGATLTTLLAALIGASAIVWQVNRQNKANIELQKEHLKHKIKRKIHSEIEEGISEAIKIGGIASSTLSGILAEYQTQIILSQLHSQPTGIQTTTNQVFEEHKKVSAAAIHLISLIEKYEIVQPEIKIFQTAINVALHDVHLGFSNLWKPALRILPQISPLNAIGNAAPVLVPKPLPDEESMQQFQILSDNYQQALREFVIYAFDFRIEAQNLLLGHLFEHRIQKRKPIGTQHKVISTNSEDVRQLTLYFENETAWGRYNKEIEESVKKNPS